MTVVLPNPFPDFLRWLPNSHLIQYYCRHEANASAIINEADLIFCLDFNGLSRLQEMQGVVARAKADKIIIDHHIDPDTKVAKQVISFPNMCATSEIIFRLIYQLGGFESMTLGGATCLYTGMMTDTGASPTTPTTLKYTKLSHFFLPKVSTKIRSIATYSMYILLIACA